MTCCGHVLTRREWMWSAMLGSAGSMVGAGRRALASRGAGRDRAAGRGHGVAARQRLGGWICTPTPGPTASRRAPRHPATRSRGACAPAGSRCSASPTSRMRPVLGRNAQNVAIATRVPEPGLLWTYHLDRLAWANRAGGQARHPPCPHAGGRQGRPRRRPPAIILGRRGPGLPGKEARAAGGVVRARVARDPAGALYAERSWRLPDGRRCAQRADALRRRRDPCVQQARRGRGRGARHIGHREAGGEGRHPAAVALAHRAARLEGAGRHAAHRAPGHRPITRAPSRTPVARSVSGTSSQASISMSTSSRRWSMWSA